MIDVTTPRAMVGVRSPATSQLDRRVAALERQLTRLDGRLRDERAIRLERAFRADLDRVLRTQRLILTLTPLLTATLALAFAQVV